jgi:hypothetical protein
MSKSRHQKPVPPAQSTVDDDHVAALTRRTVLASAAASAAAVTIGIETTAIAQSADPNSPQDMAAFVKLSAALTGIAAAKLAPDTDPIEIKREYFEWINNDAKRRVAFATLLQIAKAAPFQIPTGQGVDSIVKQADVDKLVQAIESRGDDTKYLARSIVLMWYLGSWYEPNDLRNLTSPNPSGFISHTVISPKAYTQGWLWRVAQAHPMGYSELQFGYWTRAPDPIEDFITSRSKGKGT